VLNGAEYSLSGFMSGRSKAFADDAMIPDSAILIDDNSGKLDEDKVADLIW